MRYFFVFLLVGYTSMASSQIPNQPNCVDIEGFQTADFDLVPADYTGLAKQCEDGKILWVLNFKNGVADGLNQLWWKGMYREIDYRNDKIDGLYKWWDENGNLIEETNYTKGEKDGLHQSWYSNGQLFWECNYKNGRQVGLQRKWDSNGNPMSEYYINDVGNHEGISRSWHIYGIKKSKESLQLKLEVEYKNGVIISEKCWDYDGNRIKCSSDL